MRHDDPGRHSSHTVFSPVSSGIYIGAPTTAENRTVFDRTPLDEASLVHVIAELTVNTAVKTRNGEYPAFRTEAE